MGETCGAFEIADSKLADAMLAVVAVGFDHPTAAIFSVGVCVGGCLVQVERQQRVI